MEKKKGRREAVDEGCMRGRKSDKEERNEKEEVEEREEE